MKWMDIKRKISSSNNWLDLKAKIDASKTTKQKGDLFELLTKLYLEINPKYRSKFKSVWLYNEVPTNTLKKLNLPTRDMGIDIIAETLNGEYWAVQCKYKSDESKSLTWKEISTFESLAFVKGKGISAGLIATTVDRSSSLFKDQNKNVSLLSGDVWRSLDEQYFKDAKVFLRTGKLPLPKPFKPHPHQKRAIKNAHKHYILERESRGKMIMPCGTGKSLTAYWIARELKAKTIVVAVPSLSLINQTLNAWLREVVANRQDVDWIAVCSDKSAGEVDSAITTQDLGIPTNTDPEIIAKWLRKRSTGLKVVFTTYQSGKVLAEASRSSGRVFDLGIMDEAHKTVGDRDKTFAHLLSDENIKIRNRVFMTATERRYSGNRDEIISMDNPEVYGDTFELLTFKEALEQDPPILSDYKILTMLIHKDDVAKYILERAIVKPDRGKWNDGVQAEMLAGVIALQKAMQKYPIKHAVSFHTSIAKAQAFRGNQQTFTEASERDMDQVETFFVSGKTPTSIRSRIVKEFASSDKALISNARCLTEGVDVPNIDGVLFADPKRSAVDIVQAVGRALRTSDGKEFGYIIIPVLIEDEADFENSSAFKTILTVLRALASNDERIVEYFRDKTKHKTHERQLFEHEGSDQLLERVNFDQFVDSIELQSWSRLAKLSWRPFEEARYFVQKLGLSSRSEWRSYVQSRSTHLPIKPFDIPSNPGTIYSSSGWKGMGDWLGTGRVQTQQRVYKPFSEAREYVRALKLENQKEWHLYHTGRHPKYTSMPSDIPSTPENVYKEKGWRGIGDWLDTGTFAGKDRVYLNYEKACAFVRKLNLSSVSQWRDYCSGNIPSLPELPQNIPATPYNVYKNKGWEDWGDWLGAKNIASKNRTYMSYPEAEKFVTMLNLESANDWRNYCKGNFPDLPEKPTNLPKRPQEKYKDSGWISWPQFMGYKGVTKGGWKSFDDARAYVRSLKLSNVSEWRKYVQGNLAGFSEKPDDIPSHPERAYSDHGWIDHYDFTGCEPNSRSQKKWEWIDFEDARVFAKTLKLRSSSEWTDYTKGEMKHLPPLPKDIPKYPNQIYKSAGWNNWADYLGYTAIKVKNRKTYMPFEQARILVREIGLKSNKEWREYSKNSRPDNIPGSPERVYTSEWKGWTDFLGNKSKGKSESK
jgi:superfamily II DNA or RNA helicase